MIKTRLLPDGTLVRVLRDGSTKPLARRKGRARGKSMTDKDVHAAAMDDPDCPPLTDEELRQFRRVPYAKYVRLRSGMTQEQFAQTYDLPLGTVRDWEQGRSEPDKAAQVLLRVIDKDPRAVQLALKSA